MKNTRAGEALERVRIKREKRPSLLQVKAQPAVCQSNRETNQWEDT
jgi:hypothetical protein